MITFTCNDCRVILEQAKRKAMKAKERDDLIRQKTTESNLARQAALSAASARNTSYSDILMQYRKAQDRVRLALEALVPAELFNKMVSQLNAEETTGDGKEVYETMTPLELVAAANARGVILTTPMARNELINMLSGLPPGLPSSVLRGNRRINRLLCNLCTNCRLPGHSGKTCPFQAEKIVSTSGKLVCPNCGSAHMLMGCGQLTGEAQTEYMSRSKMFDAVAIAIHARAPLPLTEEEKALDVVKLKALVLVKMGSLVSEATNVMRASGLAAGVKKAEKEPVKKSKAPAVSTGSDLTSLQPLTVDLKMPNGQPVVVFAVDKSLDRDPVAQNILSSVDVNTLSTRVRKDHGIMEKVNLIAPDPNRKGTMSTNDYLTQTQARNAEKAPSKRASPAKQDEVSKGPEAPARDVLILD